MNTQQRIVMTKVGQPEELRVDTGNKPEAGRGQVVVRMEAAGVSFAEIQTVRGLHPFPPRLPFVPGYDLIGRIVEVGPHVSGLKQGDQVAAMPRHGAWQEYVALPAKHVARMDRNIDPGEAVALVCNGVTAWQMLHRRAKARPGDTILVHGASGGVGSILTALAVHHGVSVIGSASPKKHEFVRSLGAIPIDYCGDVDSQVREISPTGVSAVFDHIGGRSLDVGWNLLSAGGTLVSYDSSVADYKPGQWFRPHIPAMRRVLWWKLNSIFGNTAGRRATMFYIKTGPDFQTDLNRLFDLVDNNVLRPTIAGRYPLSQANRALRELINGRNTGKFVLLPDPDRA